MRVKMASDSAANMPEIERLFDTAPFIRDLGMELMTAAPGQCETRLALAERHLQQDGVVHAGVLATVADHTAGTAGASLTAAALARPLFGDFGFGSCLLFTFATLYPEVEFRLFFIIPVKVKYLAIIATAILVYSSLSYGLLAGIANIAGMSAGYLFFLAKGDGSHAFAETFEEHLENQQRY